MKEDTGNLLIFVIEEQKFAIQLAYVDKVIRAVAVTRLKDSPIFLEGVIDFNGELLAVICLKKKFGYQSGGIRSTDQLIIVKTPERKYALIVEQALEIITPEDQNLFESSEIISGLKFLRFLRDDKGIVFICDLINLLSSEEKIELKRYLDEVGSTAAHHD
jgi:purine-binding chemotaxis protein CheW